MPLVSSLKGYAPTSKKLMLDTNIMIAYADPSHRAKKYVQPQIRKLLLDGVVFVYTDFCLREFREYFRRLYLKEFLLGYLSNKSLGYAVDSMIRGLLSNPNIRDGDFKTIRDELEKTNPGSGYQVWFQLCNTALSKNLVVIEQLIQTTNFKLVNLGDPSSYPASKQSSWPSPTTENHYTIKCGLASIDSALIDWFARAQDIDGLVTNDHDLLLAQKTSNIVPNKTFFTTLSGY